MPGGMECPGTECLVAQHYSVVVRFVDPRLPSFVDEVTVRNLVVGDASADIRVRRHRQRAR